MKKLTFKKDCLIEKISINRNNCRWVQGYVLMGVDGSISTPLTRKECTNLAKNEGCTAAFS